MTTALKIALGATGVGLVGGVIAERMLSPSSIDRSRNADTWGALHDDFLTEHPAPAGTKVFVGSEPAWKSAAVVGGAAAGVAALGGGLMFAATKLKPQSFPMAVIGLSMAGLGVAALGGAGLSWLVR